MEIVELAALLHDVRDWKYSGSETAGVEAAKTFLESEEYDLNKIKTIVDIIGGVSFKNELSASTNKMKLFAELAVVQDADRLDAIGAIGIARTFSYGGKKGTGMYDPEKDRSTMDVMEISKDEYMNKTKNNGSTVDHFYEKLLKLKDMMKTQTGKKMALKRHQFMELYLSQLFAEIDGRA